MIAGIDPLVLVALAAIAGLLLILVSTMRAEAAVKLCVAVSVVAVIGVPITRLAAGSDAIRLLVVALLLAMTLIAIIRSGGVRTDVVTGILILYIALTGVVAFGSPLVGETTQWMLAAATIACGYLQGSVIRRLDLIGWACRAFVTLGVILAVYAILEAVLVLEPLWRGANIRPGGESIAMPSTVISGAMRAQATLAHPIPLALILLLALTVALWAPRRRFFPQLLTVAVILGGILASGSRNALVLSALILTIAWAQRLRGTKLLVYLVATIAVIVGAYFLVNSEISETGSFTHRLGAIESTARLLTQQGTVEVLFGSGVNGIIELFNTGVLQDDGLHAVDNQYIFSLAASGLIGLVLTMSAFVIAAVRSSGVVRMCIGVLALEALIFDLLGWPATAFLAWALVGMATRYPHPVEEDASGPEMPAAVKA